MESVARELNDGEDSAENIAYLVHESIIVVYLAPYGKEPNIESLSELKIISEKMTNISHLAKIRCGIDKSTITTKCWISLLSA